MAGQGRFFEHADKVQVKFCISNRKKKKRAEQVSLENNGIQMVKVLIL